METKDILYTAGLLATLVLGIWNALNTRKTRYINTVTSQRVSWLELFRADVSRFCGLTRNWVLDKHAGNQRDPSTILEIDKLVPLIRLRLNPTDEPDKTIEQLLEQIPRLTRADQIQDLENALDDMVRASQRLLKAEWEKVKREAR